MNEIHQQVRTARRRLAIARFMSAFGWSVFAGLLLTVIGLIIPKIWHLSFLKTQDHFDAWTLSWLVGGGVLGLLVACWWAWTGRNSEVLAAAEIDRRFGLKERLSSAVSLPESDRESEAGRALLVDATDVASTIDVRDQFGFQPTWRLALPLIPLLLLFGIGFLPNATRSAAAAGKDDSDRQQIRTAIEEARKKLAEKKRQMVAKGLEETKLDLGSLEKKFDQLLEDKSVTKKDALVKLNDIKQQITQRKQELGSSKDLKESLNRLGNVGSGVTKKIADAMAKGDLREAQKAMAELADKLKSGKLGDKQRDQLAKDLDALAKRLNEVASRHEQEKQRLKEDIQRAIEKGDLDQAAKLQHQLDQKQQQDQQQQKLNKLAQKLQKCASCVKQGKGNSGKSNQQKTGTQPGESSAQSGQSEMKQAAQALEEMADQLQQMQQDLDEMENLEDLERIAQQCQQGCNGDGDPNQPPRWNDFGKGKGPGGGKRGLEDGETGTFKSRVKAKLQRGQTVITGSADGDNISGRSVSEARELIQAEMSKESDPLENQQLPRSQREHARQYFEALRDVD
jgi:hypothetical protein